MNDKKIVEHNDLITGITKMNKLSLKIFELTVSKIDTKNPPENNTIILSKQQLFNVCQIAESNRYTRLHEIMNNMQKQTIFIVNDKKKGRYEFENITIFPYTKWTTYDDDVVMRFSDEIMPYLINLKTNFTQFALKDITSLNSKYSIVMYKWFCMNFNQYENYKDSGTRTVKQLNDLKNPIISIKKLRLMTNTEKNYKTIKDLTRWVIDVAVKDISKNTHFNITYKKLRTGRRISDISFSISKKAIAPLDYKNAQQDPAYLSEKENNVEREQKLALQAMQNPYTKVLIKELMLSPLELTDVKIMASLQFNLYPIYDDLVNLSNDKIIEKHLKYVKDKMTDYSKKNIAKYLVKSAKDYRTHLNLINQH